MKKEQSYKYLVNDDLPRTVQDNINALAVLLQRHNNLADEIKADKTPPPDKLQRKESLKYMINHYIKEAGVSLSNPVDYNQLFEKLFTQNPSQLHMFKTGFQLESSGFRKGSIFHKGLLKDRAKSAFASMLEFIASKQDVTVSSIADPLRKCTSETFRLPIEDKPQQQAKRGAEKSAKP